MRQWTQEVLGSDLKTLGATFYFTSLTYPLSSEQLWLSSCWYRPDAEQAMSLPWPPIG